MALVRNIETRGLRHSAKFAPASGQTFVKGDFLVFNGSGQLTIAVAAGNNVGGGALIVGQANENALDDYGNLRLSVGVTLAQPGTQFKLPIYHATASSAVFNPNELGGQYELAFTSGSVWGVDIGHNTNKAAVIVDVAGEDYPGWLTGTSSGAGTVLYPNVWIELRSEFTALTGAR